MVYQMVFEKAICLVDLKGPWMAFVSVVDGLVEGSVLGFLNGKLLVDGKKDDISDGILEGNTLDCVNGSLDNICEGFNEDEGVY